jgi:hypothetical protein
MFCASGKPNTEHGLKKQIKIMLHARSVVLAVSILLLFQPANASQPIGEKQAWSHALKQIPIGQFTLDISGSLRLRYEYAENYNRKEYGLKKNDGFLLQRFRLQFDVHWEDRLRLFLQFQDARVFDYKLKDSDFISNPNKDENELQQAFIETKPVTVAPVYLKLGRQVIEYGDSRIFGPGDWGNTGRVLWDAAKVRYATEKCAVDTFYGRRIIHDPHRFNDQYDRQAYGLYGTFFITRENVFDIFYILELDNERDTPGESGIYGDLRVHTTGFRMAGAYRQFDYDTTYARQFGGWGTDKMSAWALHAGGGYTFSTRWSPRLGIDYVYGSGDDDPEDGTHKTFNPAFGSMDKYYGWMNLFSWRNIINWQFSASVRPNRKLNLVLDYHIFRLAQDKDAWYSTGPAYRRDKTGKSGSDVGDEIDFTIYFSVTENLNLRAGYAHFFPGDFVQNTGPHGSADWVHVQWLYAF